MIPNDLRKLYHACKDDGYDLAIGSRYVTGVNVVNWPMSQGVVILFCFKIRSFYNANAGS